MEQTRADCMNQNQTVRQDLNLVPEKNEIKTTRRRPTNVAGESGHWISDLLLTQASTQKIAQTVIPHNHATVANLIKPLRS